MPVSPWQGVHCVAFSLTDSSAALAGPANRTSIAAVGNKRQERISTIILETFLMVGFHFPQQRSPCFIRNQEPLSKANRSKSSQAVTVPNCSQQNSPW